VVPSMAIWKAENRWQVKLRLWPQLWPAFVAEVPSSMEPKLVSMKNLVLPSGLHMPMSGLGMCCRMTALGEDARRSVLWYLLLGGRHLDTAALYSNEMEIGHAIREAVQRGIPRKDIFLTSKTLPIGYENILAWFPAYLQNLGLTHIDLMLVHHPGLEITSLIFGCGTPQQCRQGTWTALTELRGQGLIRAIGVSNFGQHQIQELMALGMAPVEVNQLEYHPWAPDSHHEVVDFCHRHSIAVTAYCSLGGIESKDDKLATVALKKIAASHGRTASQVLLRWSMQRNISVIPGTGNPSHMEENLDIASFHLSEEEMTSLQAAKPSQLLRDEYVGIPDKQS